MSVLEYVSTVVSWEIITETGYEIDHNSDALRNFQSALEVFNSTVPLSTFSVDRIGSSTVYTYAFVAQDGREWNQQIDVANGVTMNFDVPDFWNETTEFAFHRDVRRFLVELIQTMHVTDVEYTWQ